MKLILIIHFVPYVLYCLCDKVMDGLAATRLIRQHEQAAIHHQMRTAALMAPNVASTQSSSPSVSSGSTPAPAAGSSVSSIPNFPDITPVVSTATSIPLNTGRRPSPPLSAVTAAAASAHVTAEQIAAISSFPSPNASVWPRPYTRVPIIAATAGAADEDGQQCLAAGMDMVITKPIDRKGLQRKLAKIPSRFSTFDSI
jgi:CheY-like chemotaxis protein